MPHALSILLVVMIGGFFVFAAACIPFSTEKGWRRWLITAASSLVVVGALGFFGSALSAVGGLNWLPSSIEWPAGYVGGVVTTPDGFHIVPHTPSGRVQVYDADWVFLRGWHVSAGGGTFKLFGADGNHIHIVTARGQWHYVFDLDGQLISKSSYLPASYSSFPSEGESLVVPTAPWLWPFTNPGISWGVAVLGIASLVLLQKKAKKTPAHK